jgi:hypothetical protein
LGFDRAEGTVVCDGSDAVFSSWVEVLEREKGWGEREEERRVGGQR